MPRRRRVRPAVLRCRGVRHVFARLAAAASAGNGPPRGATGGFAAPSPKYVFCRRAARRAGVPPAALTRAARLSGSDTSLGARRPASARPGGASAPLSLPANLADNWCAPLRAAGACHRAAMPRGDAHLMTLLAHAILMIVGPVVTALLATVVILAQRAHAVPLAVQAPRLRGAAQTEPLASFQRSPLSPAAGQSVPGAARTAAQARPEAPGTAAMPRGPPAGAASARARARKVRLRRPQQPFERRAARAAPLHPWRELSAGLVEPKVADPPL